MLGTGIVAPILPLYAASFATSYSVIGIVVALFAVARIFTNLPAGSLADRFGRKPVIMIGMAIFGLGALIAAFATNIYYLAVSRLIQGIGAALYTTTALVFVSDIAPASQRGRYMSSFQGSFTLGIAIGPAIGGFLTELGGFRAPFLALMAMALVGTVFSGIKIRESLQVSRQTKISLQELKQVLKETMTKRNLLILGYTSAALTTLVSGIRFTALPLYGEQIAKFSPSQIGTVLGVSATVGFLALRLTGSMIDRYGSKPLLVSGFLIAAASSYAFILTQNLYLFIAVAIFLSLAEAMANPAQAAAVIGETDVTHRGLALGVNRIFFDLGIFSGPLIVGVFSDYYGLFSPFVAISVLCVFTAIIAFATLK